MTLYLYSIARYRPTEDGSQEFVEFALPFSAHSDEAAALLVADSLKLTGLKDKINLSLFKVFRIGEFRPDDRYMPVFAYSQGDLVIDDFSALMQKVEVPKDEQE